MDLRDLQRTALNLSLRGARLPLTLAERTIGRGRDTSKWPPVLAFEKVEANVKEAIGRVSGDDSLVALGRLERTEVAQREEAAAKEAEAKARRSEAHAQAEERREALEETREDVQEQDAARAEKLAQDERRAREAVEQRAAQKRAATRAASAMRKQAVAKEADVLEADRLRTEAEALGAKEAAIEAQGEVLELDKAVQAKKATRRTG